MTVTAGRQAAPATAAIALFATLAGTYVLSQFLRNSIGVIAPDIAAEMHIPAAEIGILSSAFLFVAAIMGVAGLLIALVVREPAPAAPSRRETLAESILGIRAAMRIPSVGRLFLMQMATYSSFVLFAGLWGGPYLTHVYGYGLTGRGNLLLVPAIAQILGLALYGWSDRAFGSYRAPIALGAFVTAGLFVLLAIVGTL